MSEEALDLMYGLILEDGRAWGEVAADFQVADAEAVLGDSGPRLHFITRPRGGSKSTDLAAIALSWLIVDAPPYANGHIVAFNSDQAAIVIDAAAALVSRTPELEGVVVVENERILAKNGAWVRVLPQSGSGSWGLRGAHLLVCDEFCQWDDTRNARRVWTAIRSTVQKVPGCRLVLLSSAGEPSHWSRPIFDSAMKDPLWRVSETPGPVPWQSPEDLAGLKRDLLPSEYERLVLNIWSESEDRAITPEDYNRAKQRSWRSGVAPAGNKGGGARIRHPQENVSYIITVDIGIKNDATVLCVAHRERLSVDPHAPYTLIVDHLERWAGSKRNHVQIERVKSRIIELSSEYNKASVYADPYQFANGVQSLKQIGVQAQEWPFTATSVGQVATSLVQVFHNGLVQVPDTPELETELLAVKLRESTPGVTRLYHDSNGHDDQAVAIGMAAHLLVSSKEWGEGAAWIQAYQNRLQAEALETPKADVVSGAQNFIRSQRIGVAGVRVSTCREPRYFGIEELCVNCGLSPANHAQKLERIG